MIELNNNLLIGQGTNRACYIHPKDSTKCIKINISNDLSETNKELVYYNFLKKNIKSWKHLPKHYDNVKTNLGLGQVFDLIRDFDGQTSKTLSYYIYKEKPNIQKEKYLKLLEKLKKYTLEERIIVRDLNIKNILLQKIDKNTSILIIIDGLSGDSILNFLNYPKTLCIKKINNLWNAFEKKLKVHFE